MLVKRYVVNEVPEALTLIRRDLGSDAMILSTKKIQTKGFLGLFSRNKIEVIAAAKDSVEKEKPTNKRPEPIEVSQINSGSEQTLQEVSESSRTIEPATIPVQGQMYSRESIQENRMRHTEQKLDYAGDSLQQVEIQNVVGELQSLRKVLNRMTEANQQNIPKPIIVIRKLLLEQGMDNERVEDIVLKLLEQMDYTWDFAKFRFEAQQILLSEMSQWQANSTIQTNTRVAAFVGPTGVGKTTTIAKIAAEQVIKCRKKIALITMDTYRIAAVEQLRTYANILNLPLEVVFTPEDYKKALQTFKNYDLVLIDTAGRNYHEKKYIDEIEQYFSVGRPEEIYLVLSATSKMQDVQKISDNFSQLAIDKFLFTKLDETTSFGVIYNVLRTMQKPFTYVTDGQDVPDNLFVLTYDKLVDLLIGDSSYV